MYLIVGLGNPGKKYADTKHNMGFDVIDTLVDRHRIPSSGLSMKAMYGRGMIAGQKAILVKPMTYMNLSGEAVAAFVNYYKVDPATELIVIYDDIDIDPGLLRVRKKGSAGSHKGMKSIIEKLGTEDFLRVRVGIGHQPEKWDLADFVLAPFPKKEREAVDAAIERAADAVEMILSGETDRAMEIYNQRERNKEEA